MFTQDFERYLYLRSLMSILCIETQPTHRYIENYGRQYSVTVSAIDDRSKVKINGKKDVNRNLAFHCPLVRITKELQI